MKKTCLVFNRLFRGVVDFSSMNWNFARGVDRNANFVAPDFSDHDPDVIADQDLFSIFPA